MRSRTATLALAGVALAGLALAGRPRLAAAQQSAERTFPGYNPGRCAVAARVIDGLNRHDRRDTTRYTPQRDTLFTATTRSVQQCEASFGGATTEATETLHLARVQLLTKKDQAAIATARRHMGNVASRSPEMRAWELYLLVTDNLNGKPARVEQARQALAQLDKLGKAAASVRTLAHAAMADDAIERFDDATMRTETAAVVAAWQELDAETRLWRATALASALVSRAQVEALVRGGDAARAVMDSARGIVPPAAQQARMMVEDTHRVLQNIDKKAAPLDAQFWYNTGKTGTTRPAAGRVSLVVPVYRPCTGGCLSMLDGVRRIARQFRDQDLDVTFRTRTYGFYLDTAPALPLAEAKYDSLYLLGSVGLPGALAIAEVKYSFKADGRRSNEPTPDDQNFPGASVLLIDRRGIIRYAASYWNSIFEERVTKLIERAIAESVASR
jgi:cytochrome oxidase Cu insertion factor (SCO1/SenC/PrrC family)